MALLHTYGQTSQQGRGDLLSNLEAAKRGEPRAIDDVIGECLPQVSAYLSRRGATDPDGLANTVMVEFLRNLPRLEFASTRQMWSYINWISRSRLTDERRKSKPEVLVSEPPEQPLQGFDEHIVDQIWVTSMLAELTDEQREILELRFLNDLSIEDTAHRTGKSQTAVKGLQRRAINALLAAAGIAAIVAALVVSAIFLSNLGNQTSVSSDPADERIDDEQSFQFADSENSGSGEFAIPTGGQDAGDSVDSVTAGGLSGGSTATSIGRQPFGPVATATTTPVTAPVEDVDDANNPGGGPTPTTPVPTSTPTTASTTSTTSGPFIPPPNSTTGTEVGEEVIFISGNIEHVCAPADPATFPATCSLFATIPAAPGSGSANSVGVPLAAPTVGFAGDPTAPILTVIAPVDGAVVYASDYVEPACDAVLPSNASTGCDIATTQVGSTAHGRILATVAIATGVDNTTGTTSSVGTSTGITNSTVFSSTFTVLDTVPASCGGFPATIIGTFGDDFISGTDGRDVIASLAGDDHVVGDAGDDIICLGSGDDTADGGPGSDIIYGQAGIDSIWGKASADVLYGGQGDDFLRGNNGDDIIFGGEGNDDITGGSGNNTIHPDGDGLGGEDGLPGEDGYDGTLPNEETEDPDAPDHATTSTTIPQSTTQPTTTSTTGPPAEHPISADD